MIDRGLQKGEYNMPPGVSATDIPGNGPGCRRLRACRLQVEDACRVESDVRRSRDGCNARPGGAVAKEKAAHPGE